MGNKEVICIVRKQKMLGNIKGLVISKRIVKMEQWDVHCTECGKFILTEKREHIGEDIKCIAGSYKDGCYDKIEDAFYCIDCAKKRGSID